MIEVGKYYTDKPEFTKEIGKVDKANGRIPAQKMTGKCIQVTPRLVTLEFANGLRESFRHDEVR